MVQKEKTTIADDVIEKALDTGAKGLIGLRKLSMRKAGRILITAVIVLSIFTMFTITASASEADAEGFITTIIDLLKKWIPRLGGMIIVVGGIQLGIGFKDDNADGKTRGMQCMIGGAIVAAIGGAINF
ncbi:MAG: hypothetical protein LBL87_00715 [Ruminococcus sp.]|jgi:UDP-N-acetylmuramyl pentapeptide phosphotransferase/UDP-N-acetylglucosamine-1-phosphate transferase|nr:hypothetical protein [Ruminococcus sp.]